MDDKGGGGAGGGGGGGGGRKSFNKTTKTKNGKRVVQETQTQTHQCFHCGTEGTRLCSCSQCHRAYYCGRGCQRKHWKQHKRACAAAVAAEAKRATRVRDATAAARAAGGQPANETCVICCGPPVAPVELPCGHAYCGSCLAELRSKGVGQACPLCRAELPPGVEGLWDLALRIMMRIEGVVKRGEASWGSLGAAEQEEMEQVVAMWTEAAAQGHTGAQYNLGLIYDEGKGVARDVDRAIEFYTQSAQQGYASAYINLGVLLKHERKDVDGAEEAYRAAGPGDAKAHYNLGNLLMNERKDVDGAIEAYRAAIAADPGDARAHCNLGVLLKNERKDVDGAEEAYRAAIAVDPGFAEAHRNLGILLHTCAFEVEANGDLTKAASMFDEAAERYTISFGADTEWPNKVKANAARVRARRF